MVTAVAPLRILGLCTGSEVHHKIPSLAKALAQLKYTEPTVRLSFT